MFAGISDLKCLWFFREDFTLAITTNILDTNFEFFSKLDIVWFWDDPQYNSFL